jgi:hypothetical protein
MPLEAQARNRLCARLQAPHVEFIQSYDEIEKRRAAALNMILPKNRFPVFRITL